jgi:hypothetical protein
VLAAMSGLPPSAKPGTAPAAVARSGGP